MYTNNDKRNNKYEYDKVKLNGLESKYIYLPLSVITDKESDMKRIGVFSYLKIHSGLNDVIGFTIPDMVKWCGMKPDRRLNGSCDKLLSVVDSLRGAGYLTYLTETSRSTYMKCRFNADYHYEECSDGFAVVYLDEIEKIMSYKRQNLKDGVLSNATILLVFAYLRNKIKRRPNELKPEEQSVEKIQERKKRIPDAYCDNVTIIADEIGISSKTVSKIIDILEYELKLIVTDRAYRIKNENNEFRTPPIIFANAYKRDGAYLLVTGDDYARTEIELKADSMNKQYGNYTIDKKKRKVVIYDE